MRTVASTKAASGRSPLIGKFCTARSVCTPYSASAGTGSWPRGSFSILKLLSVIVTIEFGFCSCADDSRRAVQEGIGQALLADRGDVAMAGMYDRLGRKRRDPLERGLELSSIRERQIGAADRPCEKTVSDKRVTVSIENHVSGRMTRHVNHGKLQIPELDRLPVGEPLVRGRRIFVWDPIQMCLSSPDPIERLIEWMQVYRHIPAALQGGDRSEERRVGKECRSRWSTWHQRKK